MNITILIIDDEKAQRDVLAGFFKKKGFEVKTAPSGTEGIGIVRKNAVDVVLSDYKMPDKNGVEVLKEIKSINPEVVVILMTAFGSIEGAVEAMKSGAFDYISKPINLNELDAMINKGVEHKHLISENRQLKQELKEKHQFSGIIFQSRAMEEVLSTAARVASNKTTVIIRGESGTGKELIAKAVHYASPRSEKPLIIVNCAALSESLLESELFGHEKGAFTGADKRRIGRFEQANGGTLFIDEIGEISGQTQVKLLRFLQEGTFEHVGGNETVQIDVRIIAATHRNLEAMVQEGTFRDDLYYRLNVVSLFIPPLRERREDISLLIDYFIKKYRRKTKKTVKDISKETVDLLMKYNYPGNVRELENIIEHAVVLARENILVTDDLPITLRTKSETQLKGSANDSINGSFEERVSAFEIAMIHQALKQTNGIQTKAAKILGMTERHLRYKLKKYGLK